MKKLIIALVAFAMVFGFTGCKKDADEGWKETELYVKDVDEPEDCKIFFSLSKLKNAGENINDYFIIKVAVLKNPGFTKVSKYEFILLETGEKLREVEDYFVFPTTLEGFYEYVGNGIIDNTAIIYIGDSASLKKSADSTHKSVYTFDDGTKLTIYKSNLM